MKGIIETERLKKHCERQFYFKEKIELDSLAEFKHFKVYMPRFQKNVFLAVLLRQEEELIVEKFYYYAEVSGIDLAILDSYITICQGKPVEAIDRLTSKEIDFYLRDKSKVASFTFYPHELFDILAIGEELKTLAFGSEVKIQPHLDVARFGAFKELSYSEQLEVVEDILGEYFFVLHPTLAGFLTCDEIDGETLLFTLDEGMGNKIEKILGNNLESELRDLLTYHLHFRPDIKINK